MGKIFIIYVALMISFVGWAIAYEKKHPVIEGSQLERWGELEAWQARLHQDSCMFEMAFTDERRKQKGPKVLIRAYNDYLFDLAKSIECDRLMIRKLKGIE